MFGFTSTGPALHPPSLAEEIRDQGVIWAGDRVEEDQVEVQLVVFQVGVAVQQVEVEESLEADDYTLGKT